LTELVEARRPIETMLALLAAERATEEDRRDMRKTVELLEDAALRPDASFLRFDHSFHYQISRADRSEMLAFFQHRILSAIAVALHEYGLFHEDRDAVIRIHRELLSAIESRDPERIRRATEQHFFTSHGSFASIEQLSVDGGGD
jgi:GntR family transcriptional repressor for pyruvate dehydrogenase complex